MRCSVSSLLGSTPATIQAVGLSQSPPGTWSQQLAACCDTFGGAVGSPRENDVKASRERHSEVNGKLPFGVVTNQEMLGELTFLYPLGLI